AARLTAVVVFPTPPFWLAIQKIRALAGFLAMSRDPVTLNRRVYRKPLVMTPARSGASQIRNTALGIHAGHLDRLQFLQFPLAFRQEIGEFVVRAFAFHRSEGTTFAHM